MSVSNKDGLKRQHEGLLFDFYALNVEMLLNRSCGIQYEFFLFSY